jgi:hypothetical protein
LDFLVIEKTGDFLSITMDKQIRLVNTTLKGVFTSLSETTPLLIIFGLGDLALNGMHFRPFRAQIG